MSRLIWVHVGLPIPPASDKKSGGGAVPNFSALLRPDPTNQPNGDTMDAAVERLSLEKVRALKLLISYVVAVVHQ